MLTKLLAIALHAQLKVASILGNNMVFQKKKKYLAVTSILQSFSVNDVAGISHTNTNSVISIYPNPAKNKLTIKLDAPEPISIEKKHVGTYYFNSCEQISHRYST